MTSLAPRSGLRIARSSSLALLVWVTAASIDATLALTQPKPTVTRSTNAIPAATAVGNRLCTRRAFPSVVATVAVTTQLSPKLAWANDEIPVAAVNAVVYDFHNRDRKGNAQAVIRDDYWYILGKIPPQLLTGPLKGDDPQWNAFGSCTTSEATGTNSCTYYASSIAYGAREFQQLGVQLLQQTPTDDTWWQQAASYVQLESPPPAAVDAELKMVLFATAMLTSPNFPGPSRELLVARFYANEVRHANRELRAALADRDLVKARQAWTFGRDSWNSYFQVVARTIVPKVGAPFTTIV